MNWLFGVYGCSALVSILPFREALESIGDYAFYCCYSITSVLIPDRTEIGIECFLHCRSLKELAESVNNMSIPDYFRVGY